MDHGENVERVKKTLEMLRAEEKRLVKMLALPHPPADLFGRIQANLELLRQASARLAELENRK